MRRRQILGFDAVHTMSFEYLDDSVEPLGGGTKHLGGHIVRDLRPVMGELLLLWVPNIEQEKRCLEIDLSFVLDRHWYVLCLPDFFGLFFLHMDLQ